MKLAIFDCDGTLVDSAPDIQHALNAALKNDGLQRFDLAQVRGWIGDGARALLAKVDKKGAADESAPLAASAAPPAATAAAAPKRRRAAARSAD